MNDFQRLISILFCCYSRQKRKAKVTHLLPVDTTISYIHSGINALDVSSSSTPFIIADFGSSHGRHSIQTIKIIIEYLRKSNKLRESPIIVHNDLPTNDWTRFFRLLIDDNSYQALVSGRSFYEQCLSSNCLSIAYSSASLHYLSKKPCNIINHCYIHFGNENEREIFRNQSKVDFNLFIEHRSRELLSGGILILNIPSVDEKGEMGFNDYFDLIYKCAQLSSLLTSQELLDFTLPFYLRSLTECIDLELFHRCSFKLIKIELACLRPLIFDQYQNGQVTLDSFAETVTMLMRPGTESILKHAWQINGRSNEEIDKISTQFWSLFEEKVKDKLNHDNINTYATYLILRKK